MSEPFPPEITAAVPPPPPSAPPPPHLTLGHVWAKLGALETQIAELVRSLTGTLSGDGGALGRIKTLEVDRDDHETRLAKLERARETEAEKWGGRAWAVVIDLAKMAGAAGIGAFIGKGGHP